MNLDKEMLKKSLSLENVGLLSKNALAGFFMFFVPVLLTCYLIFVAPLVITDRDALDSHTRVIIICMSASGLFGYIYLRRTIKILAGIIRRARNLSLEEAGGQIEVNWSDELKDLAQSFNRIKSKLEVKIRELEYSQKLTRELFQQIGRAITGSQKVDALFSVIVHGMRKILDVESCFLLLYDSRGVLYVRASAGKQTSLRDDMRVPDDSGAVGRAVRELKTVVLNRANADTLPPPAEGVVRYERNIACAPILVGGKIKGVLGAIDKSPGQKIDTEDIFLLENVAGQTGICVENVELSRNIEESYYDTLVMLARIVEAKDADSAGHLERVSAYVHMMADKLGLDAETKKTLEGGAMLHDLGKVGIEDSILKKRDVFTPEEYEIMKQHSVIGENILKPLHSMSRLSSLVRHHHEYYDGSGYPDGLKGEEIPLPARILTIADIYDALITERPYKKANTREEAIDTLKKYSGNKLDPKLVDIFISLIEKEK